MAVCFSLLLSFFAVTGLDINLNENGFYLRDNGIIVLALLFLFFSRVLRESFRCGDHRLNICAGLFGLIIACFYTAGLSLSQFERLFSFFKHPSHLFQLLHMTYGYAVLYFCLGWIAFRYLAHHPQQITENKPFSFRKVLIFWVIFLLWYVLWYLYCYPGCLTWDSSWQISNAFSHEKLIDWHPAFCNLLIRVILRMVYAVTGSVQKGVALLTLLQMLIVTFTFALCQERIEHSLKNKFLRALIFCFFLFYPVHNIYSVTLWKDVLFSVFLLGYSLCLDAALSREEQFFSSRRNLLLLFGTMLLSMLFRHNGLPIMLAMTLVLPWYFTKRRKTFLRIGISAIAIFVLWQNLFLPWYGAETAPVSESMTFPLQQLARTIHYHHEQLSPEMMEELASYFDTPEIWKLYSPNLSDPVKFCFNNQKFTDDPLHFFHLWAMLGEKYTSEYLEAFLYGTYGFWYPYFDHWIFSYGFSYVEPTEDLHFAPLWKFSLVEKIEHWFNGKQYKNTPLLFSRGVCFWLWVFCGMYCLYNNPRRFPLFLTGFFLWLVILISAPINAEFRYVYGLFTCLPLVLVQTLCTAPPKETQKSSEPA